MKNTIATSAAPAAIGPYSQAIGFDRLIFISGQVPLDPVSGEIVGRTMAEQAEQSLKNVGAILKEAGSGYEKVIKTTCFITDMSEFAAFNEVYGRFFTADAPARSCVAVKELPKGAMCEIEVIAYK